MAIVQNPVTGRTKQKFGSAVFSKSFGKNTMRTKPLDVKNPKTPKQLQQRMKFTIMVELARLFLGFIRVTFKQAAHGMSQFNSFVKTNIKTAITGAYPNFVIDFTQLIVAKGTLTGVSNGGAGVAAGNIVKVSWSDNSGDGDAQSTDVAVILIINDTKKSIAQDMTTKTRVDTTNSLTVPAPWVGDQVHVYLAFMTPNSEMISDSSFLATVTII